MSAYMVDREHVQYLVSAMESRRINGGSQFSYFFNGERREVSGQDGLTRVGQALWDANLKSINALYPDTVDHPENIPGLVGETYIFAFRRQSLGQVLEPVQVLKAINGLRYQSCEFDGWESSEAYAILSALEGRAVRALPGYDDAEWTITSESFKPKTPAVSVIEVPAPKPLTAAQKAWQTRRAKGGK